MKRNALWARAFAIILFGAATAAAQSQTTELDLPGSTQWKDTGIDIKPGDAIRITATGNLQYSNSRTPAGPDGLSRGWRDLARILPLNDAGRGALLGRISDRESSRPFVIGPQIEKTAPAGGHLFLGINHGSSDSPSGSFHVTIELTAAVANATTAETPITPVTQQQLDSIPARVSDFAGTLGDRVNFLIVGSEDRVKDAFKTAGWVTVDRSRQDAVVQGLIATLTKQSYVSMPMSELMLFGRVQDFGYAQGDPLRVVMARHHFRLWKAPFEIGGQTVWAGAGTHDIGFDRDQRDNSVTHKIDPEVDKEREYIGQSLSETGMVAKLDYMTPANAIKEAKTAHGEAVTSDGRTLIVYLKTAAPAKTDPPAKTPAPKATAPSPK